MVQSGCVCCVFTGELASLCVANAAYNWKQRPRLYNLVDRVIYSVVCLHPVYAAGPGYDWTKDQRGTIWLCFVVYSEVCQLPVAVGRCLARLPRYHYNSEKGQCLRFYYGGCDGNSNNFESEQACNDYCRAEGVGSLCHYVCFAVLLCGKVRCVCCWEIEYGMCI